MLLDQHDVPIKLSDLRDLKFTMYVKFRLTIRVRCFYISVIHLLFRD